MKLFFILSSVAGVALAAPRLEYRQAGNATGTATGTATGAGAAAAGSTIQLTFKGAGASFSMAAPTDGSAVKIPSPISVDTITQAGAGKCAFTGVNGVKLTVLGTDTGATIAPPQTIVSASCSP